jgi:hypothetical protein
MAAINAMFYDEKIPENVTIQHMKNYIIELIELEIKLYKRQDMILSEREILENRKIVSVLESLLTKIKDL